ncbi:MAG TPA: FtsW/RodA/SpoVE family cell cycle protein [Casimicrobiaceae bacterium]|nr:FtsW/RodA/SpoVE family cell cycle protein [Casimicrobiaceae bacterium]
MASAVAALEIAPPAASLSRWPASIEFMLAVAAVATLFPSFTRFDAIEGRDGRFAGTAIAVAGLPDRVLPSVCATHGALAEPALRDRLCRRSELRTSVAAPEAIPRGLIDAFAQTGRAFLRPLADAERRRGELRLQQREGLGDLLALANAIESIDADLQPYVERYALGKSESGAPLPLACSFAMVKRLISSNPAVPSERGDSTAANALLLLAAALDGRGATQGLSRLALLPASLRGAGRGCAGMALPDALAEAAALMADARQAQILAAKNDAMRELLRTAGWQWTGWMILGLALIKLSRREHWALKGVALSLVVWAIVAWLGRVPWPFGVDRTFEPARSSGWLLVAPHPFVWWLLGAALVALMLSGALQKRMPSAPQTMASRIGYPGLVMATGIGWLLLLDLSANGNPNNRYLALYHQGHLWLGMLTLSVVAFLRQPIGRALAWTLSMIDALATSLRRAIGPVAMLLLVLLLLAALIATIGALPANLPQLTSEVARLWLIVGASWFFFLRGDPLTERLARGGNSLVSLIRYTWPLLCVAIVLVGAQLITHDKGPLLIACYAAGAFVAASISMWWHQRSAAYYSAFALAMTLFIGWIVAVTYGLFELGSLDEVTAGRLENLAAPMASANDQLALVTWFQRAAPPHGFGIGAVPWCGHAGAAGCAGVPAQIQSDYTLTALVGAFGWTAAWAITIGCAIWLHRLIWHHGRVTRGQPYLISASGRVVNDDQALLSWIGVAWVVLALCQLSVTVAGNLAVLPLTGVTFPFVSFGMTSLVASMALLGLTINVNNLPGATRG